MRFIVLIAAGLLPLALTAGPAQARDRDTGQDEIARLLEGRTAGKPQECISTFSNSSSTVIENAAIVFGRGRTIWINRPANARDLDKWDALLIRRQGSQLCRQDIVSTFDPSTGHYTGNVFLGEFVPYTRVE